MENQKKCSNKKHSELNAVNYCNICNIYLCNKCSNNHLDLLNNHPVINLTEYNNQEIFTGLCQELNHKDSLMFYCKNHNKLCCAACLSKMKVNGYGQHFNCEVCLIKDIKDEKKNKLKENIKYLEDSSKNIIESVNKLKEIYEKINKSKEEIKLKISKIFTKIRNVVNEREDKLLSEVDNKFDESYFKEDIIKKGEKLPNQIKIYLDKGKILDKDWDEDENKLISRINDCLNIEKNIQNIVDINDNIKKCNSDEIKINFEPEDDNITGLEENIQKFGFIHSDKFLFKFKQGNNYSVSNNGYIATKSSGGDKWNCVIVGDKEIPKDRISRWKIKINENKRNQSNIDICIGIGPKSFNGYLYNECWSICSSGTKVGLCNKNNSSDYDNLKNNLIKGDIIEVIVDRKSGNLSFAINNINHGIACSNIPKDDILYPTVVFYEQGLSVEIV